LGAYVRISKFGWLTPKRLRSRLALEEAGAPGGSEALVVPLQPLLQLQQLPL
jgi:hypothetical protein